MRPHKSLDHLEGFGCRTSASFPNVEKFVTVVELNPKHSVRERFNDLPFHLDGIFTALPFVNPLSCPPCGGGGA